MIVAGGGTGEVTLFYAEQLNHTNAEIIYLDFSSASMQISQRRACYRKIGNIVWIRSWIEEVRYLGISVFDHAQCSGVLHHLKRPILGLKMLKDILISNGGMNLMVYAEIGRTAVYQIQNIIRTVRWSSNIAILKELELANHTLTAIPVEHWFHIGNRILDHKFGNIGIYDLLLHKRDVAFSISSLREWITTAGLTFVDHNVSKTRFQFNIKFYTLDEILERKIGQQSKIKQWATTEILISNVLKHRFFVSKDTSSEANLNDPFNHLFLWGNPVGLKKAFQNPQNRKILGGKPMFLCPLTYLSLPSFPTHNEMQEGIIKKIDVKFAIEVNPFSEFLMTSMLKYRDGAGLKSLYLEYRRVSNTTVSEQKLYDLAQIFYTSIKDTGMILLRDAHVLSLPKSASITLYGITSI